MSKSKLTKEEKYHKAIGDSEQAEKKLRQAMKEIFEGKLYEAVGYEDAKQFIDFVFSPSSLLGIAAAMELKGRE